MPKKKISLSDTNRTGYADRSIWENSTNKRTKAKLIEKTQTHRSVRLPIEIADRLMEIAETRGSTIEEVLTFMLRNRDANKVKTLGLDSIMPFGKYAGLTVESIIRNDQSYMEWISNNVDRVELDNNCCELMSELEDV